MQDVLADFAAEATALEAVLTRLDHEEWLLPTPADRWDVRDSVVHLAMSNQLAEECVVTGTSTLIEQVMSAGSFEAFEEEQLALGRALEPSAVLSWWRASNQSLVDSLTGIDPETRIPWGPQKMGAASFVTARLMETWAHGLDCLDALGRPGRDTVRLRHVAHLGLRALPYAFAVRDLAAPGPVRLVLQAPDGATWRIGKDDATTVVEGTAGDWCRAAVNRDRRGERSRLHGSGPDLDAVILNVQAYLSA